MPNLKGAGAEFIPNTNLPHYENEVIKLSEISDDEFIIGHIYGGIQSPTISAFTDNETTVTSADPTIYEVKLIKNANLSVVTIDGKKNFTFTVSPNPTANKIVKIRFNLPYIETLDYFISSLDGKILDDGEIEGLNIGNNTMNFSLENANTQMVILTFIFDHKFMFHKKYW